MKNLLSKPLLFILLSLLFSFPILLPYIHKGYFPTHDGEWAVVRLSEMVREIKDHQFPPRMSGYLNFSYGYPLFNFAYPFPYYVGTLIHFFHVGFVDSIKLLFAISIILSGFFMMLASESLWKNRLAGTISGVLYLYFPYRFVDLFARGSLGEIVAFAFFPLLLFLLLKIANKDRPVFPTILAAISFAALITTHNIMAVYFLIIATFFIIAVFYQHGFKGVKFMLISLILGLSLSAFFWLPALTEKNYILLSKIPIADRNLYFVSLPQLITARLGYGVPTDKDGFSYQLGWPFITLLMLTAFVTFIKIKSTSMEKNAVTISFVALCLIFVLMMFSFSTPVWKLPLLSEINYPWTLLGPLGFLISLLAGFLLTQKKWIKFLGVVLTISAVVLFMPYAKPQGFFDRGDSFYTTNDATTTSSSELLPLWVKEKPFQRPDEKVEIINGFGTINDVTYSSNKITFKVNLSSESNVRINTIYYPGWNIQVNNRKKIPTYQNKYGVMELALNKGSSKVVAAFTETPLRLLSNIISVLTFSGLVGTMIFFILRPLYFKK